LFSGCVICSSGISQNIQFERVGPPPTAPQIYYDFKDVLNGSLGLADLDGDQDLDVVVTGKMDNGNLICHLHINDGQGNFVRKLGMPFVGVHWSKVTIRDFDGDQDQDLLITGADGTSGRSDLYWNLGGANFLKDTLNSLPIMLNGSQSVADFDDDGDEDLFYTEHIIHPTLPVPIGSKFYVQKNNGQGVFTLDSFPLVEPLFQGKPNFADVDNDGDLDMMLVGLDSSFNEIGHLYLNDSLGGYYLDTANVVFDISRHGDFEFGDFNSDGHTDMILTNTTGNVKVLMNDGSGVFVDTMNNVIWTSYGCELELFDADGDQDLDLIFMGSINAINKDGLLFINDGFGNFTQSIYSGFYGVSESDIVIGDLDGDTLEDVLITGNGGYYSTYGSIAMYINAGMGQFTRVNLGPFEGITGPFTVTKLGSPNQFLDDVILGGTIFKSNGFGYEKLSESPQNGLAYGGDFISGDVDGDNDLDLFGKSYISGNRLFLNDGNNGYQGVAVSNVIPAITGDVEFIDADGDNDLDLIATGLGFDIVTQKSELYLNDGSGQFTLSSSNSIQTSSNSKIAVGDIDQDQDEDFIFSGYLSPTRIYNNGGTGNFSVVTNNIFGMYGKGDVELVDLNNDNAPDLIITGDYKTEVFLNQGGWNFALVQLHGLPQLNKSSIATNDVDSDGDLDVFLIGIEPNSNKVASLFLNNGQGVFTEVSNMPFEGVSHGNVEFLNADYYLGKDLMLYGLNAFGKVVTHLYLNKTLPMVNIQEYGKNTLRVFPNPNNGVFSIELNEIDRADILIYDLMGRLVYEEINAELKQKNIDSQLSNGVYTLVVQRNNLKFVCKIIIQ
jgi:hypothetical protein